MSFLCFRNIIIFIKKFCLLSTVVYFHDIHSIIIYCYIHPVYQQYDYNIGTLYITVYNIYNCNSTSKLPTVISPIGSNDYRPVAYLGFL